MKVGDLGLAKSLDSHSTGLTQTGMMMGTPHYISPEQARADREIDFRADIYSLGCTLYHLLTGEVPYRGPDAITVIRQHLDAPLPAILKVWPQCPVPLARLVAKMLKKSRHERPASYADLIAQLEAVWSQIDPLSFNPEAFAPAPRAGDHGEGEHPREPQSPGNESGLAGTLALPAESTPAARRKSKLPLYCGIAAVIILFAIGGVFFVLPRKEPPLTKAQRLIQQREAAAAAAAVQDSAGSARAPRAGPGAPAGIAASPAASVSGPAESAAGLPGRVGVPPAGSGILPERSSPPERTAGETPASAGGTPTLPGTLPAAEPWQDVLRDPAMLSLPNAAERTPEGLRFTSNGTAKTSAAFRDGAVRMRASYSGHPALIARAQLNGSYSVQLHPHGKAIRLWRYESRQKENVTLQTFSLPHRLQPEQNYELELRVVGPLLTVRLNGEVLGTATDTVLREGSLGVLFSSRSVIKSLEVLDLDAPGGASAAPVAPTQSAAAAAAPSTPPPSAAPTPPTARRPVAATPTPVPATPVAKPLSPTGKWLGEQEAGWQAGFAKEVSGPFEKGVGELKKQYLAALEGQLAAATKAGKLEDAVALRAERERLAGGGDVPAEDEALAPPALQTLRASYRTAFAKLDTERFTRAKSVHARTDALLAQNQSALTQRQRLDEALEIKTQREALTAAWLQPPAGAAPAVAAATTTAAATPKPAPGKATTPPRSKTPKLKPRELVERLLAMGATVFIGPSSAPKPVENLAQLPGAKFAITRVDFHRHEGLTPADLDIVEQLTDATEILLLNVPATDATIRKLATLPALKRLQLRGVTTITDASFDAIAAFPLLQSLNLNGGKSFSRPELIALGKNRTLFQLAVNKTPFTEEDFAAIASLPELRILDILTLEPVPAPAWARLAGAKNLSSLDASNTPMSAEGIAEIGKLAGLEELILGDITLPDAALAALAALKSLRRLETGANSTLDGSVFTTWPLRPAMRELSLNSTRSVNDETLRAIATAFPKLTDLNVPASAGSVTVAGLAHLTKLRQLTNLWLRGDAVDDAGLAEIVKRDSLTHLEISNARVTEAGVPLLTKLGSLRTLDWVNPPVTGGALKSYGKLRALTTFNIGPRTPPESEQKLKAALPNVKIVR